MPPVTPLCSGNAHEIADYHHLYPDESDGAAAAGVFVRDFARALVKRHQATVIAPSLASRTDEAGCMFNALLFPNCRFPYPNPTTQATACHHSHLASRATRGESSLHHRPTDYIFALWALPSGAWARQASLRYGIPYGMGAWQRYSGAGQIPLIRLYLGHVLRHAAHRYADGLQPAQDVTRISA